MENTQITVDDETRSEMTGITKTQSASAGGNETLSELKRGELGRELLVGNQSP